MSSLRQRRRINGAKEHRRGDEGKGRGEEKEGREYGEMLRDNTYRESMHLEESALRVGIKRVESWGRKREIGERVR